ncbi:MAG: hypothetical protein PHX51_02470 [Clostridia bacterium]|nr:hypothetical protein [Clostridia bacterium]
MDNMPKILLKIDNEFKNLIRPLRRKEYLQLEENLLADGCRDPIITWNGYIIDGHNRYEICNRHQIPFQVRELSFDCRAAVIAWICKNQLGRRNITEETRKFLIGMQYESEKTANQNKNPFGINQFYSKEGEDYIPDEEIEVPTKTKTAHKIADENNVTHATVQKYAIYTRALETIGQKLPEMVTKILSGRYKISHKNITELAKLSTAELKKVNNRMEITKKPFVQYCNSRNVILNAVEKQQSEAMMRPSVKDMPKFDPDAPLTELTLTIPSWISSIKRTVNSLNTSEPSIKAKTKLEQVLNDLQNNISELNSILSEEDY